MPRLPNGDEARRKRAAILKLSRLFLISASLKRLSERFNDFQCGFVVRLVRHVLNVLDVPDHPFAVDDDNASPQQPELLDDKSVLHAEVKIAIIRVDMDILDMFCGAESLLGERQIYRQGEDGYIYP